ncbi:hypothetical protein [Mucilaginibacter lappiensis]|uniref:Uncharacterized protein n=1 Tax=Mucilaginibacter lappiensis TaxID=354630 RepID=A0A841JL90_9SPHI|nr:hypothetical protein [Mucilaginibacter lappiensis]MBB6129135.1 hypothetical protein [Mucilaginibacter lappiensis]
MQEEAPYINTWCKTVEKSLDWGKSSSWSDHDFEKLGELIFQKTGTLLSITTLKRIWGRVKYNSSPTTATLNTMARFAGSEDWRTYKKNIQTNQKSDSLPVTQVGVKQKKHDIAKLAVALVIAALGFLAAWNASPKKTVKPNLNGVVKFSSRKVTDGLPNSVVFDYDASALNIDSVTLQQTWDPSRVEKLATGGRQHTSIYYYPGYFTAKLIANGQIKKESPVFIKTHGWMGIIRRNNNPIYLADKDIHQPGGMGLDSKTLALKLSSPVFNDQWLSFYNVGEFNGLEGGNFTLETTLRNTSRVDESSCRKIILYILGKQNAIIIPLADKGCISDLDIYTSSDWVSGKDHDLSAFGCDFGSFQKLKCEVRNMKLSVYLNNKLIFTKPITQTITQIAGICIAFEGSGEIKNIKLGNSDKVVLDDQFAD